MVVPLGPGLDSVKKLEMQVAIARGLEGPLKDVIADASEEDEEAGPDEVGEAGSVAQEEGALGVLAEQVGDLASVGLDGFPGLLTAPFARQLVERLERRVGEVLVIGNWFNYFTCVFVNVPV